MRNAKTDIVLLFSVEPPLKQVDSRISKVPVLIGKTSTIREFILLHQHSQLKSQNFRVWLVQPTEKRIYSETLENYKHGMC